jgi:hypothetical protein
MTAARVAGQDFDLTTLSVERSVAGIDPEPIREHYVVIQGRRYPPKQALAESTGLDRADFTTHQARSILRRVGFGVYRRGHVPAEPPTAEGPHGGSEATLLAPFRGRWVAQNGLEILFDADEPTDVLRWLRRHGKTARVWLVPASPSEVGSTLSAP